MDKAKELLDELKAKTQELHEYLEAHPDEANPLPSWLVSIHVPGGDFLMQGCSNFKHEVEIALQLLKKLHGDNPLLLMFILAEIAEVIHAQQQGKENEERPQWII